MYVHVHGYEDKPSKFHVYLSTTGIVVEDPTKTIFDFVEFPNDDIEVVDMNSNAASIQSNSGGDKSSKTLDSFYVYYSPNSRERCGWLTRKIMARQILLGLSLVLIGLGMMVCCLGVVKRDTSHVTGSKVSMQLLYRSVCSLAWPLLKPNICMVQLQLC